MDMGGNSSIINELEGGKGILGVGIGAFKELVGRKAAASEKVGGVKLKSVSSRFNRNVGLAKSS